MHPVVNAIKRYACQMATAILCVTSISAIAQNYPNQPIKIVVPFAAGGTADILARVLAEAMAKELGQPVLVENRGGAGGNIGSELVARHSAADGYTLLVGGVSLASNVSLYKTLPFDPMKDLKGISLMAEISMVLSVTPGLPAQNVADLIRLAKADPGKLSFASSGVGTSTHLAGELFKSATGIALTHVPYRSTSQAMADVASGRVQVIFDFLTLALPQIQSGAIRPLAVSTKTRSSHVPNLPTPAEAGVPAYEYNGWMGLLAPSQTPEPIITRLAGTIAKISQTPDYRKRLDQFGSAVPDASPARFDALMRSELIRWERVAKAGGFAGSQ
jgi:tripartite-type tricarboxylate transporter receptor subunit TctC